MAQTPPPAPHLSLEEPSVVAPSLPTTADAPQQHIIRLNFPEIAALAQHERWLEVVCACENLEIAVPTSNDKSRLLVTAPMVLAYLILDEIPPAYFALKRLPAGLIESPLPQALFALLASVSERKYLSVYTRLSAVVAIAQNSTIVDVELGLLLVAMAASFKTVFQKRTIELLSRAYAAIPASQATAMLNMPVEVITSTVTSWTLDTTQGTFVPSVVLQPSVSSARPSKIDVFEYLASGAAHLESTA
ncbi:hypothetical protein FRB96_009335 [Tulasnella sp. 330]|nr:hypothetical protein FRB96_009335 [Tulasnella sp. 330]KAG8885247.1 hypothetical protein FRB97_001693 [Tulasnella sp. 331]KAG8887595.1 hypothetical protein FRB98_009323 [Tulasnella sp. 332]